MSAQAPPDNRWLFSPAVDLAAFLGSAVASLVLLAVGVRLGLTGQGTPDWTWIVGVLLIDVAHVWSTAFVVYFDPVELRRRWLLYSLTPVLAFAVGFALYRVGETEFWRVLAYLAVFHFVRQQWGWVAMYRGRLREQDTFGLWLDRAAIYMATIYPLVYWHANLDSLRFRWFRDGDFVHGDDAIVGLPEVFGWAETILRPIYWAVLTVYFMRSAWRWRQGRGNPGKDVVVATTALCWYLGIVVFNSDYAFTVTNVVIHGVPYFVLVFVYWRAKRRQRGQSRLGGARMALVFLATLWLLAYVEELLWDRGRWHDREWLFGEGWEDATAWQVGPIVVNLQALLVPLLAVPQVTHYILDGFIWRRKSNPDLALLGPR